MFVSNLMFRYEDGRIYVSDLSFIMPEDMTFFGNEDDPMHSIEIGYPDTDWHIVLRCTQGEPIVGDNAVCRLISRQAICFNGIQGTAVRIYKDCLEYYNMHFCIAPHYGCNTFTVQICSDHKTLDGLLQYGFVQNFFGSITRNRYK